MINERNALQNVKAVIFDIGRVLVSLRTTGDKFQALMHAMGIDPDKAFDRFWSANPVRRHMTGNLDSRGFYAMAVERYRFSLSYETFAEGWNDLFDPIPGMRELFGEVAARYPVSLLSDTDPLHWAKIRALLPWLERVPKPTLSFEVGYLKPHPAMFAAAAANCGREMGECLFIDDLIENVDGARFHGMPALHFTGVEKLRRDLTGLRVL